MLPPSARLLLLPVALFSGSLALGAEANRPEAPAAGVARTDLPPPGPLARYFPNVTLRTQDDEEVRFYDDLVRGRLVLINFIYTNCDGICPLSSTHLADLQDRLGDRLGRDIFLISVCIDSARDTPESMKEYADIYGARPGWTFVTGQQEDVDLIRRRLGVYDPDDARDRERSNHTGMLTCVNDPTGRRVVVPVLIRPALIEQAVTRLASLQKLEKL